MKTGLSKLGVPNDVLDFMFDWTGSDEDYLKVPEAKGSIQAVRNEAFFIPLYELFLTYGGIFRLTFGPKVCLLIIFYFFFLTKGIKYIVEDNSEFNLFCVCVLVVVLDRLGSFYC